MRFIPDKRNARHALHYTALHTIQTLSNRKHLLPIPPIGCTFIQNVDGYSQSTGVGRCVASPSNGGGKSRNLQPQCQARGRGMSGRYISRDPEEDYN